MVKTRKSVLILVVAMLILTMGLLMVACDDTNTVDPDAEEEQGDVGNSEVAPNPPVAPDAKPGAYNVTFMFKETEDGPWKEYITIKSNDEGKLTLPADPVVYGYSFRAWYQEEAFTNKFDGTNVRQDMKVFAKMADKYVTVKISDVDGSERVINKQPMVKLDKLKADEEAKAKEANLSFDSYYTNADCTTKYQKDSENTTIYARYVATVVFDNGYEELQSLKVVPGQTIQEPVLDDNFIKFYMSKLGISYIDENKAEVNFSNPITKNTNIRVLWHTPGLQYNDNSCTGVNNSYYKNPEYQIKMEDIEKFPVISIPATAKTSMLVNNHLNGHDLEKYPTLDDIPNVDIEVVNINVLMSSPNLKKIIIPEGVKMISNLSSLGNSHVKSIELPSTLEIIEYSFNGLDELTEINIPEGVQVINDSFWAKSNRKTYDVEIAIPDSVLNMNRVPNNLKFNSTSNFKVEGNTIIEQDPKYGKTLVSIMPEAVVNGTIKVEEGIEAIQVGIVDQIKFDYLVLPTTFKTVAYTEDRNNYPYYKGKGLTILSEVAEPSTKPNRTNMDNKVLGIITHNYNDYKQVIFQGAGYPEDMHLYAFTNQNIYVPVTTLVSDGKVVYLNVIPEGQDIALKLNALNKTTGKTATANLTIQSGAKITQEDVLNALKLTESALGYKPVIQSVSAFGETFDFDKVVNKAYSIEVVYAMPATGIVTEENTDGTLTVTGATADATTVVITDDIDGKKIVAIKDSAFEGNKTITEVIIGKNVKVIGNKAFKDAENLIKVTISEGSLAKIGDYAFEGVASTLSGGAYTTTKTFNIALPLANLGKGLAADERAIGINAFNTPALKSFTPVESEKSDLVSGGRIVDHMRFNYDSLKVGNYYFAYTEFRTKGMEMDFMPGYFLADENRSNFGIFKVASKDDAIQKCNLEWYATASGMTGDEYLTSSQHSYATLYFGFKGAKGTQQNIATHIMEGSVQLYGTTYSHILFVSVDKIDKNAFSYVNDAYVTENRFEYIAAEEGRNYTKEADIKEQNPDIFTEGWLMNRANADNNSFMSNAVAFGGGDIPGYDGSMSH